MANYVIKDGDGKFYNKKTECFGRLSMATGFRDKASVQAKIERCVDEEHRHVYSIWRREIMAVRVK